MKKISSKEYKKIILDILKYIDNICRKNGIKYTLTGGSLIGAIREKGILAWDDDIDIVMNKKEYDKLFKILSKQEHPHYYLLDNKLDKTYPITYAKLIDIRTIVKEPNMIELNNYGAFVDIFVNHNIPYNNVLRRIQYTKIKLYQTLINGYLFNEKYMKKEKGIKRLRTKISKIIGINRLQKKYNKAIRKYDDKNTKLVVKDYIGFGYEKDIMSSYYFNEYIDVQFEDMKAMSIKEYDKYLKGLFGDYMTPPSKDNQICHSIDAYWRDSNESKKRK